MSTLPGEERLPENPCPQITADFVNLDQAAVSALSAAGYAAAGNAL
jgi:hypothetical protein